MTDDDSGFSLASRSLGVESMDEVNIWQQNMSGDYVVSAILLAICQEGPLILQKHAIILTNITATPRHSSRVLLGTGARNIEARGRPTADFNRKN
ncbi:hypothetical protein WH297_20465 [Ochrobactrum vermis]|uniref:Uncharacterized protein n=1 Tax=Ochrobactrum vermis TaxID=1827297 RepID=A0ABU8PIL0_9HYPH|nr:hypothetical protein [Ochrobactrum vermis]PQZ26378.1 hypothetical protein CQZ93_20780 [Ochrobactrum vermis]